MKGRNACVGIVMNMKRKERAASDRNETKKRRIALTARVRNGIRPKCTVPSAKNVTGSSNADEILLSKIHL